MIESWDHPIHSEMMNRFPIPTHVDTIPMLSRERESWYAYVGVAMSRKMKPVWLGVKREIWSHHQWDWSKNGHVAAALRREERAYTLPPRSRMVNNAACRNTRGFIQFITDVFCSAIIHMYPIMRIWGYRLFVGLCYWWKDEGWKY